MYQWTHKEPTVPITPGKLETALVWPHAGDKKTSPKGESKIPKLMASTPKARIQLVSSLFLNDSPFETDRSKVAELKQKLAKCETSQELVTMLKAFLSEHSMISSESSTNSGIFNGSDTTLFDRSMETTLFNVLHRQPDTTKVQTTPKGKGIKSRTTPNTPTGRADPKRFRRNLSVDSVNSKPVEAVNGVRVASPTKPSAKRMVDKATVMDVEPLALLAGPETRSIETQTEADAVEVETKKEEVKVPIPPPPPPMMNIPPPPPLPNASRPPGLCPSSRCD